MPNYSIIWTNEAFDDLLLIEDFLGFDNAQKTIDKIIARVRQLEDFPLSSKVQPTQTKQEYRFLVEGNYKVYILIEKVKFISKQFLILGKTQIN
jgi:plasmid stabilization system protein ParE